MALRMTKHTLLRPLSRRWLRGPAWQDGESIVLDCDRAEEYQPLAEPTVGLDLTSVRTPADAVAFATRFGLLRSSSAETIGDRPALAREPFVQFAEAASKLRDIVENALDVRDAVDGDADALARLRSNFVVPDDHNVIVSKQIFSKKNSNQVVRVVKQVVKAREILSREKRLVDADDRTILIHASDWSALGLSGGLIDARPYVFDRAGTGEAVPPGQLRVGILPETLLEVCYLTTALALAEKEPLEICPECRRVFIVEDGRQKFCTPTCASRARFRRFQEKQSSKRKGARHGKATRPR
jgi:hypothetical protein